MKHTDRANARWPSSTAVASSCRHDDFQQCSSTKNAPIIIDDDDAQEEGGDFSEYGQAAQGKRSASSHTKPADRLVKDELSANGFGGTDEEEVKEAVRVGLSKLDAEIKSVVAQLEPLQALHASLTSERRNLETRLSSSSRRSTVLSIASSSKPGPSASKTIDYQAETFPWSPAIMSALKSTFGLTSFRLCQEGVINSAIDGRDIVCVMPTGGGKSLTYQLPAVTGARGLTVVISPSLALIWDQVRALKELGVECAMLTGSTTKDEQNSVYKRIEEGNRNGGKDLRMCYVTPEKISKSKRLMSVLEKANGSGRLKRFVIDEAHCCSQLGHDFRPDYNKLSALKTLFPRVPIQAVTATLSTKTMPDLLKILRLPPICDGRAANGRGTVFFSAPLFRPNLHYRIMAKPSSSKAVIEKMSRWIKDYHPGKSGIIYCFSKKDAETVAESLSEWSSREIKTGVYHAGIDDWTKEKIHVDWRKGKINCICATIAFGLGIDKGDVRYIIHHSMSKSLDGYYQETGRAGRDGKDSDCVLFYRAQDAARMSSMIYGDVDGTSKLHEMLRFAQDFKTCRKVAFAKYFSSSSHLSAAAWDHSDVLASSGGTISTCGICDNCTRDPATIITQDVTVESWKILKALEEVVQAGGRVTLANMADLVRGLGGGSFAVPSGGGRGKKRRLEGDKGRLNLETLIGGKVTMNKDYTEALLIHLILLGYLGDSYHATAYLVNVYVIPGPKALRLSRLSRLEVETGSIHSSIEFTFPDPKAPKAGTAAPKKKATKKKLVTIAERDVEAKDEKAKYDERVEEFEDEEEEVFDMSVVVSDEDSDAEKGSSSGLGEVENSWKFKKTVTFPARSVKRVIPLSDDE